MKFKTEEESNEDIVLKLEESRCCGSVCGVQVVAYKNGERLGRVLQLSHETHLLTLDYDDEDVWKAIGLLTEEKKDEDGDDDDETYSYPKIRRI